MSFKIFIKGLIVSTDDVDAVHFLIGRYGNQPANYNQQTLGFSISNLILGIEPDYDNGGD